MSLSDMAAAEDAVLALIEYLVAPMLPNVSSGNDIPLLAQQESVAKQVHAVVLLYNYYYRKQNRQVEFLGFKSFCQLAVIVKPTLMGHMKLMHHAHISELDDVENQLSLTEKAIINACDISSSLDPLKNTPNTEDWEASKVAILLVDSSKENCFLQFSSITQGVWSVIERDFPCTGGRFEIEEGKQTNKRKRNSGNSRGAGVIADEADLRQLVFSAIKEATGTYQDDLVLLEKHVVHSLSREKSAVQFYIVQCTQSIDEELRLSVKSIIESLQGPLVIKRNSNWAVTPVVEYFHLLPFAGIIEEWFSREVVLRVGMEKVDFEIPQKVGNSTGNETREDITNKNNAVDFNNIQSRNTVSHLEQRNGFGTRMGNENVHVTCLHKARNSVGNAGRNDFKRETNNLQQKNDPGIREVGLQDVNEKYSEMTNKLSIEAYNTDKVDFVDNNIRFGLFETETKSSVTNGNRQRSDEATMEMNNNGSGTVFKSGSLGGSQNMGIVDPCMVYCIGPRQTVIDVKNCQKLIVDTLFEEVSNNKSKCGKNTNATGFYSSKMGDINAEASKQLTSNADQQPTDKGDSSKIDEVCMYRHMRNVKTDTDSSENKQSDTKIEFSKKITIDTIDSSGLADGQAVQKNMETDDSKIDAVCMYTQIHNGSADSGENKLSGSTVEFPYQNANGKTKTDSSENKQSRIHVELSNQITNDKGGSSGLADCHTGQQNMDIDDSSVVQLQNENKERNGRAITKVYCHKKRASSSNGNTNGKANGSKVELDDPKSNTSVPKFKDEKTNKAVNITCSEQAIVPYQLVPERNVNLPISQTLNENALSQTVLTYLVRKKSKLVVLFLNHRLGIHLKRILERLTSQNEVFNPADMADQLRNLEDEIAVCDKSIQAILDGGENELALQVETLVDACYDTSLKDEGETRERGCQQFGTQVSPQFRRKILSDAVIPSRNSCQELDDICNINCWTLAKYQMYPANGGFRASIKLKGLDFEYFEESELCVKPRLARESAALKMIARLQNVAGQSH